MSLPGESGEPPDGPHAAPHPLATWTVLGVAVVLIGSLFAVRLEHQPDTSRLYPGRAALADAEPELLPGPEMNDEYLPCSDCHEGEKTNRTPREFQDEHAGRTVDHGTLWCLHCHDAEQRDSLHLADGQLVGFDESWKLCTQCHGKKLADWRAGVHGKRTGHWSGTKQYRTCVACHDPHSPPFRAIAPEAAPRPPEHIAGPAAGGAQAPTGSRTESRTESSHEES